MAGQQKTFIRKATIGIGAIQSDTINLGGMVLCGIVTPATVAGTALTLKGSPSGGTTLNDVYDQDGVAVSFTVAASRLVTVLPTTVPAVGKVAIVSNVAASGAAEIYQLLVRDV